MKYWLIFLLNLIIWSVVKPITCHGSEQFVLTVPDIEEKPSLFSDLLWLSIGAVCEFGSHEFGHFIGAEIVNQKITFDVNTVGRWNIINERSYTDREKRVVNASGFLFPFLLSEVALDFMPKENPFVVGFVFGVAVHSIFYMVQDATSSIEERYNDIATMDKAGLDREITYPLLLIIPLIQTYRLSQDKNFKDKWDFWIGSSGDEVNIKLSYKF